MAVHTGPKYRVVLNTLRDRIIDGTLKPGDKLPSTKALCAEFACSSTAVNTAVIIMTEARDIVGHPGTGRFVAERP